MDKCEKDALKQKYWNYKKSGRMHFESPAAFIDWCEKNEYEPGKRLLCRAEDKGYTPDNAYWDWVEFSEGESRRRAEAAKQWDDFVTPIRERFQAMQRQAESLNADGRECWRYEHPDLEREGIVFESSDCL